MLWPLLHPYWLDIEQLIYLFICCLTSTMTNEGNTKYVRMFIKHLRTVNSVIELIWTIILNNIISIYLRKYDVLSFKGIWKAFKRMLSSFSMTIAIPICNYTFITFHIFLIKTFYGFNILKEYKKRYTQTHTHTT